ncbi:cupin domain-containing protein [Vibrio sp. S4M6]|uniref:cupin domain-containing protein n=1 Tax=Vibrio sinus TaxID=2946865 RepID=UPI002029CA3D|nr:cupin domain-containing protein [Vibrio sinus]MCL9782725.1 cupin domain-containing protein [Vibrio sinus]
MKFQQHLNSQLVRYMELVPGTQAFIDARTPGSHLKDNFCIIGAGVAESSRQHVHIQETSGFNIGAAGQPPGIKNSLHSHTTAELFIVFKGNFRFYWGNDGQHDAVLSAGDIISIPTNLFRGFEVVGRDYGFMYSVLGGDDSGGGVTWHPNVIRESQGHGLYLCKDKSLVDIQSGDVKPDEGQLMPILTDDEMATFDDYTAEQMRPYIVKASEYQSTNSDFTAVDCEQYALTGGPESEYDFQVKSKDDVSIHAFSLKNGSTLPAYLRQEKQVLINFSGDTLVSLKKGTERGEILLTTGDVFNVPFGVEISLRNLRGDSFVYQILGSDVPTKPVIQQ